MTWARKRQLTILAILLGALLVTGIGVWFLFFRTAPSCMDNTQNGDELGVDCGGSCTYLCSALLPNPMPIVKFARTFSPYPGRTDVIAYIDNPNSSAAASSVHYTVEVYDSQNVIIGKREGDLDLPPAITTPLYIPNVVVGDTEVTRAFVTIETASVHWVPALSIPSQVTAENVILQEGDSPRVTATLRNKTVDPVSRTAFVATLFDVSGNAVAASGTLIEGIAGKGSTQVIFTWPSAFSTPVARVEILPVLPLAQ